jgi:hypothetical protein
MITAVSKPEPISGSIVPAARFAEAKKLSLIAKQSSLELIAHKDDAIMQAVVLSTAISQLREALTPAIMSDLMKLSQQMLQLQSTNLSLVKTKISTLS